MGCWVFFVFICWCAFGVLYMLCVVLCLFLVVVEEFFDFVLHVWDFEEFVAGLIGVEAD